MANENAAIWEVQSGAADGTEATATATHTQLFNPDSNNIEDGAFIDNITVNPRKAIPENEAADDDNNEIQDMGITGLDITMTGLSGDTDNDTASNLVNKLIKWWKDGNTTTGYIEGRFGLRLDNAPQWNVVPNGDAGGTGGDYGFHLSEPTFEYIGEKKDVVKWSITLSLGGDIVNAL
jgi:hypothetical protein